MNWPGESRRFTPQLSEAHPSFRHFLSRAAIREIMEEFF
jgi:hypothetical protein